MTLVMITYQKEHERLICLADSRLNDGSTTLTDNFSKILPLSIRFGKIDDSKDLEPTNFYDYGFAFSGSSMNAMSTYGWSTSILNNLSPINPDESRGLPLSINAVAGVVRNTAHRIFSDQCQSDIPREDLVLIKKHGFEIFLFGFCPRSGFFKLFCVKTDFNQDKQPIATYAERKFDSAGGPNLYAIGSGLSVLRQQFPDIINSDNDLKFEELFRRVANDKDLRSVGGPPQAALCTETRFVILPIKDSEGSILMRDIIQNNAVIEGYALDAEALPL